MKIGDRVMITGPRFPEQVGAVGHVIDINQNPQDDLPFHVNLFDGPPRTPRGILPYDEADLTVLKRAADDDIQF